jgi:hypothetical protein
VVWGERGEGQEQRPCRLCEVSCGSRVSATNRFLFAIGAPQVGGGHVLLDWHWS